MPTIRTFGPASRFSGAAMFPPRQHRRKAGRDTGCIAPRTFFGAPETSLRRRLRGPQAEARSALAAFLAQTMDFECLGLRPETESLCLRLDQFGDPCIADLLRTGAVVADQERHLVRLDRKSTRLNSSHMSISYAVFCLKKKKI